MQNQDDKKLPNNVGIGLKSQHYQEIIETQPDIGWFEVHPENYMGDGGLPHYFLSEIHKNYPLSMHGVGLSLGSADGIDEEHLSALKKTVDRHQPEQVSEHLSWSHWNSIFLNDLLPLPYTDDFLSVVVNNIHKVQDTLKRTILVENPSAYLGFNNNAYSETEFLNEIVKKTGCGLLLDVNNVYVSAHNQQFSSQNYLDNYPLEFVGEIHLAGHAQNTIEDDVLLIDDHGSEVIDSVWEMFGKILSKTGKNIPVLIEWDTNIPEFSILINEMNKAKAIINKTFVKEERIV